MMKFVMFENTVDSSPTNNIIINTDKIVSVYEILDPNDEDNLLTVIYAGDITWIVKNSIKDVLSKLNKRF